MYEVLVPVDTNEDRAIRQAEFVSTLPAADSEVAVTLLFVFSGDDQPIPEELQRFKSADRITSVRRAIDRLDDHGVSVTIIDESGDPAEIITHVAQRMQPDLIVLGGRKRSPIGKAIFGSVTQSVILDTDHPVAVTGVARSSSAGST